MSKLIKREDFTEIVELWFSDDEKIGTFQVLDCDEHGNSWSFTDKSGADNCIECIKEICEPKVEYRISGFENLEDSLEKITIRRTTPANSSEENK